MLRTLLFALICCARVAVADAPDDGRLVAIHGAHAAGRRALRAGDFANARVALESAVLYPGGVAPRLDLVLALLGLGRDAEAASQARIAFWETGNRPDRLARDWRPARRLGDAAAQRLVRGLERRAAARGSRERYLLAGLLRHALGQAGPAWTDLRAARRLNPRDGQAAAVLCALTGDARARLERGDLAALRERVPADLRARIDALISARGAVRAARAELSGKTERLADVARRERLAFLRRQSELKRSLDRKEIAPIWYLRKRTELDVDWTARQMKQTQRRAELTASLGPLEATAAARRAEVAAAIEAEVPRPGR